MIRTRIINSIPIANEVIHRFSSPTFLLVLYAVPSFVLLLLPEVVLFRRFLKTYSKELLLNLHLQCQVTIVTDTDYDNSKRRLCWMDEFPEKFRTRNYANFP